MASFCYRLWHLLPLLYVTLLGIFVTLFCRKSPLYDTFLYVKVRFITHYLNEIFGKIYAILYVYPYNPTYKRNIVAKIIYIVLHFVLFIVVDLCKQNTK